MGPVPTSTVLSTKQEIIAMAFQRHTLLPLDDYRHALQGTIPQLSRSALHRCFQRPGISRLPKKKCADHPIDYIPVDFVEVRTKEGRQDLFVTIVYGYRPHQQGGIRRTPPADQAGGGRGVSAPPP